MDYRERITIEPGKRGGKPCIRGLRITVLEIPPSSSPSSPLPQISLPSTTPP
ncbi:MAG: DUF433 domain-containing protein [Gemmatimonadetes bacterium]|nr:DUF433 domain-containing protein [Gemmatimonadota bacterium]